MSIQSLIVIAMALLAALFFGRKAFGNLARGGRDAGCGCGKSDCCRGRAKAGR